MEDVGKFYGALGNFPAIWHILWQFSTFSPVLVHFTRFGMLHQEKSGNPEQWSYARANRASKASEQKAKKRKKVFDRNVSRTRLAAAQKIPILKRIGGKKTLKRFFPRF
jgi:hypothetical protein